MLKDVLQNGIAVKTKNGDFRLLRNGVMEELAEQAVMIRPRRQVDSRARKRGIILAGSGMG